MDPKDRIGLARRTASGDPAAVGKQRIDKFPDYLVALSHLDEPSRGPFADQGVSVGQSFGAADLVAVERDGRLAPVVPEYLVVGWVDLHDAGIVGVGRPPVGAVVKQQDPAVVQKAGIMLVGYLPRAPFPDEPPTLPVDDSHGAGLPETD